MRNVIQTIILAFSGLALVAFVAFLSGTIVWLIWPVVIPNVFPGLGFINPSWCQSVCLVWLFTILFKSSISTKK